MDVTLQLVQAYLRLNGYLTAAEYPLLERRDGGYRVVTDIDLLAVRFSRSDNFDENRQVPEVAGPMVVATDSALECPDGRTDMIVAEVKQGLAFANPATRDPRVLAAALARFGCCLPEEAPRIVRALLQRGIASSTLGHTTRMVLFAARGERAPHGWHWVQLDHVIRFVDQHLRRQKESLRAVDFRDPALGWFTLLQKCGFKLEREKSV